MKILLFILLAFQLQAQDLIFFDDGITHQDETLSWKTRVIANGGTVSENTLFAVDTFFIMVNDSSLRSKLLRANLFCGDAMTAAQVPQILAGALGSPTLGGAIDTAVNFSGAEYVEATGWGGAATKYLKTGFIPSAIAGISQNSTHISLYIISPADAGAFYDMGSRTTARIEFTGRWTDNNTYYYANENSGAAQAVATAVGYVLVNRVASNSQTLSKNGAVINTFGGVSVAESTTQIYVFGTNNGGTATSISTRILGGYTIGSGLTTDNIRALNNIMEYFQDKIGRGIQ